MSAKIIPHVFGSLMALDKSIQLLEKNPVSSPSEDMKEVLTEMNKVAHLIQLQFAKGDTKSATRSLHIFYGLLSMIRPLVTESLKEAAGVKTIKKRIENFH